MGIMGNQGEQLHDDAQVKHEFMLVFLLPFHHSLANKNGQTDQRFLSPLFMGITEEFGLFCDC